MCYVSSIKKIDEKVSICLITADISYLEQLKKNSQSLES